MTVITAQRIQPITRDTPVVKSHADMESISDVKWLMESNGKYRRDKLEWE